MSEHFHAAIDLGAESGRVMVGCIAGGRLSLEEVYRFPTGVASRDGGLFWRLQVMEAHVFKGLGKSLAWDFPFPA
jgi:rhamnulokinase